MDECKPLVVTHPQVGVGEPQQRDAVHGVLLEQRGVVPVRLQERAHLRRNQGVVENVRLRMLLRLGPAALRLSGGRG